MEVNIRPGTASAGRLPVNGTIPVGQTTSPTDSDDLLNSLDTDTRTWFTSLITSLAAGTKGRAADVRALLNNAGPTAQQLRQIGDLLAARRTELASVVHNLGVLATAVKGKDTQLQTVVRQGNTTLAALASQNVALTAAVNRLPGTLQTTRSALSNLTTLSDALRPAAIALLPTARKLPSTLRNAQTLFTAAALLPLKQIPPFVNAVLPLAAQVPPVTRNLSAEIPPLENSFKILEYAVNEVAYNGGAGNPGFLYWLAWGAHNLDSGLRISDAYGAGIYGISAFTCQQVNGLSGSLLTTLLGTTATALGC